jgi:hypothetical protein
MNLPSFKPTIADIKRHLTNIQYEGAVACCGAILLAGMIIYERVKKPGSHEMSLMEMLFLLFSILLFLPPYILILYKLTFEQSNYSFPSLKIFVSSQISYIEKAPNRKTKFLRIFKLIFRFTTLFLPAPLLLFGLGIFIYILGGGIIHALLH